MQRAFTGLFLAAALMVSTAGSLAAGPFGQAGQGGHLGLGLRAGAPSGLSMKYWLDHYHALDVGVGAFGHYRGQWYDNNVHVHVDYLRHVYGVFGPPARKAYRQLPVYMGVGALFSSPEVIGVRGVLGLTWLFDDAPFDIFLDVAPTFVITPGMGFGIGSGLGGRFYF